MIFSFAGLRFIRSCSLAGFLLSGAEMSLILFFRVWTFQGELWMVGQDTVGVERTGLPFTLARVPVAFCIRRVVLMKPHPGIVSLEKLD